MAATQLWTVWGLEASVVVTDPGALDDAAALVRATLTEVEMACSRFRSDSELSRLAPRLPAGACVGPTLARLVEKALLAAVWTDGDVDPTLGRDLAALGYDRDITSLDVSTAPRGSTTAAPAVRVARRTPGWQRIGLADGILQVPADLQLDLGATAKAVAADLAAQSVSTTLGCGVLVNLGGDIATAGPAPEGRWEILVQDDDGDPAQQISLAPGWALATSSTSKRRWLREGRNVHHILDPRFGLPAQTVWRSATVAAPSCLRANALSTAAIVRGHAARGWLDAVGADARLVDQQRRTLCTGAWPRLQQAQAAHHG
ncbi:FAD:protein FMN transferase [Arthrobacter sp. 35W]|uniref:FAD:protein FMN transferase n=1 Tax=Arthrobacter sp. 35W TaxID=1132441 RepID=UPI00040D0E70|nr:FAD:protein FMN transferase [Arthrobacter sp. 35W]